MLSAAIVKKLNVDAKRERYVSARRGSSQPHRIIINLLDTAHLAHEIAAARFLNYILRKC